MPDQVQQSSHLRTDSFTVFPAIDLLGGTCVRLREGRFEEVTRYTADPLEVARGYAAAGARWIHLVDLDAARRGRPAAASAAGRGEVFSPPSADNRQVLRAVREAVSCRLQVGGGIRSEADVEALLEAGVDRLLLGTVLAREPRRVESWCTRYGAVFAAAIDARRGRVMVSGWREDGALEDVELGRRAAGLGVQAIVYTSIDRDGTLSGPDLKRTIRVAAAAGLPVILSGGIGGGADVEAVWRLRKRGLRGVVIGKALYEGRVALAELLRRYDRAAGDDSR